MHGYLADKRTFTYQLKFFERNFDVFAFDLKGFGQNAGMEKPYSLDDYILEVEEYKYKNSIKSPNVIAHSFGGRISLKATANDNSFCSKLVLTGCAGLKPKFSLKKFLNKSAFNFLKNFIKKEKLSMFYSKDYNSLSPVMKESFKKIVNEHLDYTLPKINNQTLIIFGKNDKETPLYMAKRLNEGIKNSTLRVILDAGHFCFIDKPYEFNYITKEFLLTKKGE